MVLDGPQGSCLGSVQCPAVCPCGFWALRLLFLSLQSSLPRNSLCVCTGSNLEDEHQNMVQYYLPGQNLSWAKVSATLISPTLQERQSRVLSQHHGNVCAEVTERNV